MFVIFMLLVANLASTVIAFQSTLAVPQAIQTSAINAPDVGKYYVQTNGSSFQTSDGKDYTFIGANYWYGANLGSTGPGGDRKRLLRELDELAEMGVTNLRVMASSEGPNTEPYRIVPAMQYEPGKYDKQVLDGLDFLLHEMAKRDMKAVMCLSNFWAWSGGLAQYLIWAGKARHIPYHPPAPGGTWSKFMEFTSRAFESRSTTALYHNHVRFMVNRINEITGRAYKEDPTIMAWELANEPRGMKRSKSFLNWVRSTAKLIKRLDPNHLITIGLEGDTPDPRANGIDFDQLNSDENIDYTTIHIWIENWEWYDPFHPAESYPKALEKAKKYLHAHEAKSSKLGKPLVLEEFGIARDSPNTNRYDPKTPVHWRNTYYRDMLNEVCKMSRNSSVSGANIWAYGGTVSLMNNSKNGRWHPGSYWHPGDAWTGDPPHERQGWYSVYSNDDSTHEVLNTFSQCITSGNKS